MLAAGGEKGSFPAVPVQGGEVLDEAVEVAESGERRREEAAEVGAVLGIGVFDGLLDEAPCQRGIDLGQCVGGGGEGPASFVAALGDGFASEIGGARFAVPRKREGRARRMWHPLQGQPARHGHGFADEVPRLGRLAVQQVFADRQQSVGPHVDVLHSTGELDPLLGSAEAHQQQRIRGGHGEVVVLDALAEPRHPRQQGEVAVGGCLEEPCRVRQFGQRGQIAIGPAAEQGAARGGGQGRQRPSGTFGEQEGRVRLGQIVRGVIGPAGRGEAEGPAVDGGADMGELLGFKVLLDGDGQGVMGDVYRVGEPGRGSTTRESPRSRVLRIASAEAFTIEAMSLLLSAPPATVNVVRTVRGTGSAST
ncbi:hypothetical protein ACWGDS_17705 [Streptomyces sp. NPDC055059]